MKLFRVFNKSTNETLAVHAEEHVVKEVVKEVNDPNIQYEDYSYALQPKYRT